MTPFALLIWALAFAVALLIVGVAVALVIIAIGTARNTPITRTNRKKK